MKRQMICYILLMAALLALLVTLKYMLPQQQEKTALSVLILREGEGSAVIVICGGQTLLLLPDEADDMEHLADYLKKQRTLRVEHVLRTNQTPIPAAMEKAIAAANVTVLSAAEEIALTDAVCSIAQAEDGTLTLSVSHGENQLLLYLSADAQPTVCLNSKSVIPLETDRHSVRILSDTTRFSLRPDFSTWND